LYEWVPLNTKFYAKKVSKDNDHQGVQGVYCTRRKRDECLSNEVNKKTSNAVIRAERQVTQNR